MSYLQIKRLVDEHVKRLNAPLTVDDEIRSFAQKHSISDKKINSILLKCNLAMKRHNRSVYNKQVVHQIVQQVLKCEQEKLDEVNSRLCKLYQMMRPITVTGLVGASATVQAISRLAEELPESRHLFALSDLELEKLGETAETSDSLSVPLIVDTQEKLEEERMVLEVAQKVSLERKKRAVLREQYEVLRAQVLELDEQIRYNHDKIQYLKDLGEKLVLERGTDDLGAQVNRFGILVEKLDFQSKE